VVGRRDELKIPTNDETEGKEGNSPGEANSSQLYKNCEKKRGQT